MAQKRSGKDNLHSFHLDIKIEVLRNAVAICPATEKGLKEKLNARQSETFSRISAKSLLIV